MIETINNNIDNIIVTTISTISAGLLTALIIFIVRRVFLIYPRTIIKIKPNHFFIGEKIKYSNLPQITKERLELEIRWNSDLDKDKAKKLTDSLNNFIDFSTIDILSKIKNCNGLNEIEIFNRGKNQEKNVEIYINSLSFAEISENDKSNVSVNLESSKISIEKVMPKERIIISAWTGIDRTPRIYQGSSEFRASSDSGQLKIRFERQLSQTWLYQYGGIVGFLIFWIILVPFATTFFSAIY